MKNLRKLILKIISLSNYELKKKDYLKQFYTIPSISSEQKKIISITQKYSMTPKIRQYALINSLNHVIKNKVKGDLVECGVWQGGNLIIFDKMIKKYKSKKKIFGYDTFTGMPKPISNDKSVDSISFLKLYKELNKKYYNEKNFNFQKVLKNLKNNKCNIKNIKFIKGKVENTLRNNNDLPKKISILRIDTDWHDSVLISLEKLYPKLQKNGILIIDDYGWNLGCKKAVDKYFYRNRLRPNFFRIDHESVFLIK